MVPDLIRASITATPVAVLRKDMPYLIIGRVWLAFVNAYAQGGGGQRLKGWLPGNKETRFHFQAR